MSSAETLLSLKNLCVWSAQVQLLYDIHLDLKKHEKLVIVGESGCGKSTLLASIVQLWPYGRLKTTGSLILEDQDLLNLNTSQWRNIHGRRIGYLLQDPKSSFSPYFTIGQHIAECMQAHSRQPTAQQKQEALALLMDMGFESPMAIWNRYPHELSTGMCQRLALAMCLLPKPIIVLADEPTSGLDPLNKHYLLTILQKRTDMALIVVTHDFSVAEHLADRLAVMYAGRIVEMGPKASVLCSARHPYTQGLWACIPRPPAWPETIPGNAPAMSALPQEGCVFYERCAQRLAVCAEKFPHADPSLSHYVSCWKHLE
jgi:oligopeptide/dipeptide ABC transporter ATP-binding protein